MTRLPPPEVPAPLAEWCQATGGPRVVSEVQGAAAAWLLTGVVPRLAGTLLVVTPRPAGAADLALDLPILAPDLDVIHLPEQESHDKDSAEHRRLAAARERALAVLREGRPRAVVVASLQALADRTGDPAVHQAERWILRPGDRVDRDALRHHLFEAGLKPSPLVAGPGESSVRGDILDFHPLSAVAPVRVELFDDEVESLREFDAESQRSLRDLESVALPPRQGRTLRQGAVLHDALDHAAGALQVVRVDPVRLGLTPELHAARDHVVAMQKVLARLQTHNCLDLHPEYQHDADVVLGTHPIEGAGGLADLGRFAPALDAQLRQLYLFSSTAAEGRRLTGLLRDHLPASPRRAVHDCRGSLSRGFQLPGQGLWVANHHELLSRTRLRRAEAEPPVATRAVKEALELTPGDYVVHLTHGVALYRGMKEHASDAGTEDYLILEFDGGTLLYVPSSKVELLSRYIGAGGAAPRLDKIGGRSWSRKKANVEGALDEVADDLLELQAARRTRGGHAFPPDDDLQQEFDSSFPYTETKDQLTSIEEIKRDMEAPRAMDRLLCGDVGFGKTEMAVRAAFKCASAGRQVAVLAPTTLLVRQHLETFGNRMADHPVRVEALSRFTAGKKTTKILEGLRSGRVDILIGTHRLLSSKVQFKDLGLVVIDEEQRFGVRHKEQLKRLRSQVDVLTLSATPIPRTLHMSLVGLRDISTLREAPRGRQAIKTVVTYEDDAVVRSAIDRELAREGQVFYLYNRVQDIQQVAARVQKLVPTARVSVAHGQMTGTQLEKAARSFQEGKVDVLVCTTIIESGIDIPRVNTLIVERPDLMGLADLHQLRGRIGRSSRLAYAYFLLPHKPLPTSALKRLRALEGLSHLGAGFDVAIRDLEIRGAGNLLGAQQSGHIEAVGYDLYCRLLARAIARKSGKKAAAEPEEIDVSLGVAAFLPREYIHSTHQRMGLIRRLGDAKGPEAMDELEAEIKDRFGRLPEPADHLLKLFRLKHLCRRHGIARLFHPGGGEVLVFVRNLKKFAKAPLAHREARWVEGQRLLLDLPPGVVTPAGILDHLLLRFRADGSTAKPSRQRGTKRKGRA